MAMLRQRATEIQNAIFLKLNVKQQQQLAVRLSGATSLEDRERARQATR